MKIADLDKWCLGNADCNWVAWRDADYHNPEDVKKFMNFLDICSKEDRTKELEGALAITANQLEGVSLAIKVHGTNINVPWWIQTYKEMADNARKIIKGVSSEGNSKKEDGIDSTGN
jgi:hypothetical protein